MGTYLNKGIDFANGDQVTADKLDSLVESATFGSGAVDNSSTQLSGGAIIVKDGGITTSKIASGVAISFADGSAATPSITNYGDSDTGIYFPTDNTIGLSVGGVETARTLQISNYGCIELAGPNGAYIDLSAGSINSPDYSGRLMADANATYLTSADSRYMFFGTNNTERLRITGTGDVGIGTSSPATKLDVSGGITVSDGVRGALKYSTAQNSTSGTTISFNDIPSWVTRVTIIFGGVSVSGANEVEVVLGTGTSGSPVYVTSGYSGGGNRLTSSGTGGIVWTTGFMVRTNTGATVTSGHMVITKLTGNTWVASSVLGGTSGDFSFISGGNIALGSALTQVRVKTTSTDTFDAGQINIMYEG